MADDKQQRVLRGALEVFLRYGYRRTTMEDLARHVGMSRPALYLSFPGKEAILRAVVAMTSDEVLSEIEAGLPAQPSLAARLRYVFELWTVRQFDLVKRAPAAAELISGSFEFAADVFEASSQRLAKILAGVIRGGVRNANALEPSAEAMAHVLVAATQGFKLAARETDEMRALVSDLVRMTVAGLPVEEKPRAQGGAVHRGGTARERRRRA